ncbi:MAG: hypothetical protein FWG25_07535, partial [Promicromonosporaceae bacterium]|nr:hypothetical protein [Promicromonosporaceae bacterium]
MSESTGVIVGRVQTTEIPAFALQAPSFGYQSTEEVHGSFTSKAPLRAFFQVVASGTEPHTCRGFKRGGKDAGLDDLVSLLPENAIVLRTSTLSERDEESLEPKLAMTDILTRISEGHVYLGLRQTMVEVRVSGTD